MKQYETLADIQRDLTTGSVTCTDLVDSFLGQIERHASLNAFVEVYKEEARAAAQRIDQKLKEGTAGKLAGLVMGIKDLFCYRGHGLTASSRILEGFESQFTATSVQRLLDEDVIIIGRQGCDEFAMGSSNENSVYGPVQNPIQTDKVPGGSSGGSASAVKAGLCHASLASDTGGSIRQPAAFCDLVGLKPTYGRVSRWGLIAYASSFDVVGPITRSVEDAARILDVIAGPDGQDNTASSHPLDEYVPNGVENGQTYTIGYLREALESPGLDPEIKSRTLTLIEQLRAAGHELKAVSFPLLEYVVPCYYVLTTAEASSNLSRFDGIRYGHRSQEANSLEEVYRLSRTEGFGAEVKRRIMLGTFVLSAGYYDAYYTQAMKVRRLIKQQTEKLFEGCDFLLSPTTPSTPFKQGEKTDDPVEMFLSDIFTVHANLAGVPAISLPIGQHSNGLPIGVQLMGPSFSEKKLLNIANRTMIISKKLR
ncbi:MAG: Asp-tRNA(Asn)/Glu-tRNA(Gln) amidotransferase subunit GatA [Bacteroidota bacterium]